MKRFGMGAALAGFLLLAGGARAMTVPPSSAPGSVEMVAGGCGPGFHRIYNGRCVPNWRRPPPPVYRRCPPGMHPAGYGRCFPNR